MARDNRGMTALHCVFESEIDKVLVVGTEITKAFLDRCDEQSINEFVNAANERGRTALHSTSNKGDVDAYKLLVEKGASVIALDKKGMTASHYAFKGGIDKVLDVGTKISPALVDRYDKQRIREFSNTIDLKRGRTALHGASKKGSTRICELIVDSGDLVNIKDKIGMTALHYAFQGGNGKDIDVTIEIVKSLLRSCDRQSMHSFVNATDEEGRTTLHYASDIGIAPMCELLLEHGALITLQDKKGMTALHYAFEGGIDKVEDVEIKIAQALLHKSDEQRIYEFVDATCEEGRTALHCASDNGNAPMCELLVKCGALMTIRDMKGMRALHCACRGEIDEVIDVLVKSPGVTDSLNLKDKRGCTPVEIMLANMDYESTKKLLLKSEDPKGFLEKEFANMDSKSIVKMLEKSKDLEDYSEIYKLI